VTTPRHLRPVEEQAPPETVVRQRGPGRPVVGLLAGALVVLLGLLLWSRFQLASRVAALESELTTLEQTLAVREGVIAAQTRRMGDVGDALEDVRARLDEVQAVLDAPLPE
jgi:uncharacterized coiled-coil protein SlyX